MSRELKTANTPEVNDGSKATGKRLFDWGNAQLVEQMLDRHKREIAASLAETSEQLLGRTRDIVHSEVAAELSQVRQILLAQINGSLHKEIADALEKAQQSFLTETPSVNQSQCAIAEVRRAAERGREFADRLACTSQAGMATEATPANRLETFFDAHSDGPGIWKWRHYFDIYDRHFARFVGRKPTILEIGVFSGGSLLMWQDYFGEGCKIYGIDMIEACRQFESESVRILIGDQGDREFWRRFKAEIPPVDIIIDDGSHESEHQMVTMEEMLPHLRPGGVYLCEDIYQREFDEFIDGFASRINTLGPPIDGVADRHQGMAPSEVQKYIHSIHRYPLVTVIERGRALIEALSAPQRGTKWLWSHWK